MARHRFSVKTSEAITPNFAGRIGIAALVAENRPTWNPFICRLLRQTAFGLFHN